MGAWSDFRYNDNMFHNHQEATSLAGMDEHWHNPLEKKE
jgi:hypothetical protein